MACVELPAFPLQLLLKRHPDWAGRPVAVVERDKPQGVILRVNEQARAAGIRTGMRYSAGLSLAHTLHAGEVPPADVEHGVTAIGERLRRFSPDVEPSRDEPGVFWLNASGLSYLHASLHRWAQEIAATLRSCGFRAVVAVGFTRFGTGAIARTLTPGQPVAVVRNLAVERKLAGRVRLSRLGIDPVLRDSLHKLGVRTVEAFLQLPSGGIRRRFGPQAQRLHRLAAGELWAPLQPQRVTEPLVAHQALDDPETDAVRLLFHLKRLLDRVLAIVAARHQALAELTLRLRLDRAGTHTERIRPAAPTLDVVQLMNLVRLRLESLSLGGGVVELRVTGSAVAVTAVQQGLFIERPRRDRAAAERALARVRAEFGDEAVMRACLVEAHLPEARFAWEPAGTVPAPEPREVACRPMVRRIHARALALPPGLEPYPGLESRSAHDDESGCVRDLGFRLIERHYGRRLSLDRLPPDDPRTYDMICRSDTIGVFQIESRAQMSMLPRLKPRNYYDLVIEVSIVRLGPITGGMVHPYLRRRNGEEPVVYPHPCLEPVLSKTLGVPLFQEQVMKLAVVAADYTPGEADQLRRDMAAWHRTGRIERHRDRLVTRMMARGIAREFAERVFEQIRGFGDYGFPESHAASFALIAYATSWLRCHYPEVFACSLLNAQPMGFYTPATIVGDAARHGVEVHPVDVTASAWDCTLEAIEAPAYRPDRRGAERVWRRGGRQVRGRSRRESGSALSGRPRRVDEPAGHDMVRCADGRTARSRIATASGGASVGPAFAVRMGLRYVKGLSEERDWRIEAARTERPFASMEDFTRRTRLDARVVGRLAEAGAFARFEGVRRAALWEALDLGRTPVSSLPLAPGEPRPGFEPLGEFETIAWDYRFSAHSTRGHPLAPLRGALTARKLPDARTVAAMSNGRRVRYAGIVICRQRPATASSVTFMTLEDETGFVNLVVWKRVFDEHAVLARTASFLGVTGKLQSESGVVHIVADALWAPEIAARPPSAGSRDFH